MKFNPFGIFTKKEKTVKENISDLVRYNNLDELKIYLKENESILNKEDFKYIISDIARDFYGVMPMNRIEILEYLLDDYDEYLLEEDRYTGYLTTILHINRDYYNVFEQRDHTMNHYFNLFESNKKKD